MTVSLISWQQCTCVSNSGIARVSLLKAGDTSAAGKYHTLENVSHNNSLNRSPQTSSHSNAQLYTLTIFIIGSAASRCTHPHGTRVQSTHALIDPNMCTNVICTPPTFCAH